MTQHTTSIDRQITHIDINNQYRQLAAPVTLVGAVNTSAIFAADIDGDDNMTTACDNTIQPLVIGIDEAGRGPLLGDVVVAAAILPQAWSGLIEDNLLANTPISILTDSKKLSEKKRDKLYSLIKQHAIGHVIARIPAAVIDQVNILQATMLGMRLCSETMAHAMSDIMPDLSTIQILYDGNRCPDINGLNTSIHIEQQSWVKGDARHTAIAAASVLAKVSRDHVMYALDRQHPEYGIAKHKGYPTRAHIEAIEQYGVLPTHRRSFAPIKRAIEKKAGI